MRLTIKKKIFFILVFFSQCFFSLIAQEVMDIDGIESDTYLSLVGDIIRSSAPKIVDKYIVFTAKSTSRHVAVAFEHEKYAILHSFRCLVPDKEAGSILLEPVLFYIMEIPEKMTKLRYRLVFDGLWTHDPLNENEEFDFDNRMTVSTITFPPRRDIKTRIIDGRNVNFVYVGKAHQKISVAGSFNNWDPFMYFMEETSDGIYELTLPLPKGTHTYSYFLGTEMKVDVTNHERAYGYDGKVVSVLTL
ncbi:MAG: glycogen-binding domain-containing protein [Treponema sp.]